MSYTLSLCCNLNNEPSTLCSRCRSTYYFDALFFCVVSMKDVIDTAYVAYVDCGGAQVKVWILDSSLMLEMPIFGHTRFTTFCRFWGLLGDFVLCI